MPVIVSRLPRKVKADISKVLGLPAPGKYGNVKVRLDGITFDSLKERDRYLVLLMRKRMGEISGFSVHPKFEFVINGKKVGSYTADFGYFENHGALLVIEDVKAKPTLTRMYQRNKKMMKAIYGIDIKEVF